MGILKYLELSDEDDEDARDRQRNKKLPELQMVKDVLQVASVKPTPKSSKRLDKLTGIKASFPPEYWEEGWVLKEVADTDWRRITKNSQDIFPLTLRKDHHGHPGYIVREISDTVLDICPLSSKNLHSYPYIPEGNLDLTGHMMDRKTYVVIRACCRIARSSGILSYKPIFLGIYPPKKLKNLRKEHGIDQSRS